MKALFLIFHGFDKANGISKKIHYQVKALKECGVDARLCYYDITPHCERRLMIDNEVIADFGTGTTAKVWKRIYYAPIIKYARREKIEFVYIRSAHNANPFTLRLVKHLKSIGAKVVMEIPTYPYDQEYITRSMKLSLAVDRCFRHSLAKILDGIVTFSNAGRIFGGKTILFINLFRFCLTGTGDDSVSGAIAKCVHKMCFLRSNTPRNAYHPGVFFSFFINIFKFRQLS